MNIFIQISLILIGLGLGVCLGLLSMMRIIASMSKKIGSLEAQLKLQSIKYNFAKLVVDSFITEFLDTIIPSYRRKK